MEEYKWMKEHGNSIFQPLNQLQNTKLKYLPGFVEFKVLGKNGAILDTYQIPEGNDAKEACKPINLNEEHYDYTAMHYPKPLIAGCRYPVSLAVAKTLEEVTKECIIHEIENAYDKMYSSNAEMLGTSQFDTIKKQLNDFTITTEIKHGGDGMGELKVWREKSEKPLPNKAFHYSICLVSCSIDIGNVTYILFDEEDPNSIHATRNVLQAVADENDKYH